MTSKWRKAKAALGLNLCVYVPKTLEDTCSRLSEEEEEEDAVSFSLPTPPPLSTSFSGGLRFNKAPSPTASSKKICAICLGTMKPGHGHAIFTAECSHAFHFNCIASNVNHGNQVCPVCRAKWKEVPFHRPIGTPHGKTSISPLSWQQDDICTPVSRQLHRNDAHRQITSFSLIPPEPSVFNDDEPVDHQTVMVSNCPLTSDGIGKGYTRSIDIKMYAEVSAVPQSISRENFDILIHLKAPLTTSKFNLDRNRVNLPLTLQTSRAPVDLVTVLDISGSMAGTKLALLKRAMGFVIQSLGPSDRLSVIAFSSTARRLFSLLRMTDAGRQRALQAVNSLGSNGGTNIAEGLRKGARVMEERREKNPVGSIILLSDGQDTYSLSYQDRVNKRSLFSARGGCSFGFQIPVHAFGFGADHDAALMHSISEASGGTFSFIEAEGVIQDAFAQCIGGLLSVVVQDLRVGIECMQPDICLGPLETGSYTAQVVNDARTAFIDVGDLYADEVRDFLVSVNVPPSHGSQEETTLVRVNGVYCDPVSKETLNLNIQELRIQRPENVERQVVSIEVDRQRNRARAASTMAEARAAAERGDLSSGVTILESFRRVLSETISARAGDQLCVALDAELKEMQERMASPRTYEASGRAYVLSGLSSHSWQRATARGDSTDSTSILHAYQTPSMLDMVSRSQTQVFGGSSSQPPIRPARSFPVQPQPR